MTFRHRPGDASPSPEISARAILAAWSLVGLIAIGVFLGDVVFRSPDPAAMAAAGTAPAAAVSSAAAVWASIARGEFETAADRAATLDGLDIGGDATIADAASGEPERAVVQSADQHFRMCQWLSARAADARRGG